MHFMQYPVDTCTLGIQQHKLLCQGTCPCRFPSSEYIMRRRSLLVLLYDFHLSKSPHSGSSITASSCSAHYDMISSALPNSGSNVTFFGSLLTSVDQLIMNLRKIYVDFLSCDSMNIHTYMKRTTQSRTEKMLESSWQRVSF